MAKRKKNLFKDAPNLKRFRTEIQSLTKSDRFFHRPAAKQTRKQKRKEARLEKKSRKNAYCRRMPIPSKEEIEKAKQEYADRQKTEAKLRRSEEKKNKRKAKKDRQKQQEAEERNEQQRIEDMWDDKEIKDLEKKLGLNKRKKKDTLPLSFKNDGLDYILDVVDTDKMQALTDLGDDTEEGVYGLIDKEESDENMDELEEEEEEDSDENVDDYDDDDSDEEDIEGEDSSISTKGTQFKDTEQERQVFEVTEKNTSSTEEKRKPKWEELADRIRTLTEKKQKQKKSVRFAEDIKDSENSSENEDIDLDNNDDDESDTERSDDDSDVIEGNDSGSDEDDFEKEEEEEEDDDDEEDDGDFGLLDEDMDSEDETQEHSDSDLSDDKNDNEIKKRKFKEFDDSGFKEDIYGRLRDPQGNIVRDNKPAGGEGAYVPPAKRLQMSGSEDEKKKFVLDRLQKQLKGLVNRASENNMQPISAEIENLYLSNSRADVNDTLVGLISEACISPVLTPDRLSMELMMLVAILHGNVGSEVGAAFLQHFAKRFKQLSSEPEYGHGKLMDNVVVLMAHLFNFKVVNSVLIFDILKKLTENFLEKDVELILLLLRHVGFSLRKDSPSELKDFIIKVQTRAGSPEAAAVTDQSRVRFMLEVIMAIRNNNMRKIPNYDPEHLDHLRKLIRNYIRGGQFGDNQLHITLEDLLNAEEKGKWWLVGSAWDGKSLQQQKPGADKTGSVIGQLEVSSKLQELARKQRMNTELRRNIFFVIMTSEDYLDAFEKLIRMGLKSSQKQEIVLVIMDCCLQEKKYNPFYAYLGLKFCEYHRTYQMAFQFCIWDKFKEIGSLSDTNRNNLAKLLNHLIINKAQSLSLLKVISFGTLEKGMVRLLKQLLSELLLDHSQSEVEEAFSRIAQIDKLKQLNEGIRLFLRHFLVGKKAETKNVKLLERVEMVDKLLSGGKSQVLL